MHAFQSSLAALCLAGGLAAQTVVTFPSDHAGIQNGAYTNNYNFPYSNGISRMMALYESWDLQLPNQAQITRIGFRREGTYTLTGKSLQLEVRMGATTQTVADMQSNFDANYLTPPTTVFGPALFTLPNFSGAPGGQIVWLDLTTPYTYSNATNLLVEWRITANSNGNATFSYSLDRANFDSTVVAGPEGCPTSAGPSPLLQSSAASVGGSWRLSLSRAPANSVAFWLATVNSPLVAPYSLQPLVPGIAPTCLGQLDLAFANVSTVSTNSSGSHIWQIPVPNDRVLWNDAVVASQVAILDLFAPGGVTVSNGDQVQFGVLPANAILTSSGSATAATGTVVRNDGIITLFQY